MVSPGDRGLSVLYSIKTVGPKLTTVPLSILSCSRFISGRLRPSFLALLYTSSVSTTSWGLTMIRNVTGLILNRVLLVELGLLLKFQGFLAILGFYLRHTYLGWGRSRPHQPAPLSLLR